MSATPRVLRNFVNGAYADPETDATTDIISPVTAQVVATAPVSSPGDVDRAYTAAAKAFETWGQTTPSERQQARSPRAGRRGRRRRTRPVPRGATLRRTTISTGLPSTKPTRSSSTILDLATVTYRSECVELDVGDHAGAGMMNAVSSAGKATGGASTVHSYRRPDRCSDGGKVVCRLSRSTPGHSGRWRASRPAGRR